MNENMQVWLETLKTGQYDQAKGALDVVDPGSGKHSFCCLGVACDLAVRSGVSMEVTVNTDEELVRYDKEGGLLPEKVRMWLGVPSTHPQIVIENINFDETKSEWDDTFYPGVDRYQKHNPRFLVNCHVTELNDDAGMSFAQIAQLVEYAGGFSEEV